MMILFLNNLSFCCSFHRLSSFPLELLHVSFPASLRLFPPPLPQHVRPSLMTSFSLTHVFLRELYEALRDEDPFIAFVYVCVCVCACVCVSLSAFTHHHHCICKPDSVLSVCACAMHLYVRVCLYIGYIFAGEHLSMYLSEARADSANRWRASRAGSRSSCQPVPAVNVEGSCVCLNTFTTYASLWTLQRGAELVWRKVLRRDAAVFRLNRLFLWCRSCRCSSALGRKKIL